MVAFSARGNPAVVFAKLVLLGHFYVLATTVAAQRQTSTTNAVLTCQDALDAYCNVPDNCLNEVHGKFTGPLFARYSGPGAPEWRCYAAKDLDTNRTHYVSGADYCTRQSQLTAINSKPPCNGSLPPTPPTPPGPHDLASSIVFSPGLGGIACYRIPAIVQTVDASKLIAFAEARHGSCSDGAAYVFAVLSCAREHVCVCARLCAPMLCWHSA